MQIYSFDWATKKALTVYNSKTQKVKQILNSIEEFEKFLNNLGGGAIIGVSKKLIFPLPSSTENKEGGSAKDFVRNSKTLLPSPFYPFQESDANISALKIVFRQHEDLKKNMVREKNKLSAFKQIFEIANVADKEIEKTIFQLEASIIGKEKAIAGIKKVLEKKVKQFDIWNKHLKDIKAVGPAIASGLIGELGGKHFDNDESLKHYAGMVAKKEFHDYNRYVKVVLYQFAEQVIRHRTPKWRELYDNMKIFYAKKHSDWSKGKVNNYAKKFIETKFLLEFWGKWKEC